MLYSLILISLLLSAIPEKRIEWVKDYETARKLQKKTGKLIVCRFTVNKFGDTPSGISSSSGSIDLASGKYHTDMVAILRETVKEFKGSIADDFIWVHSLDEKLARKFNIITIPVYVLVDPEEKLVGEVFARDKKKVGKMFKEAYDGYYKKKIRIHKDHKKVLESALASFDPRKEGSLVVVIGVDKSSYSKRILKIIGNPWVAEISDRVDFVIYEKKEFKQRFHALKIQFPAIIIYDPVRYALKGDFILKDRSMIKKMGLAEFTDIIKENLKGLGDSKKLYLSYLKANNGKKPGFGADKSSGEDNKQEPAEKEDDSKDDWGYLEEE